jgi:predicted ATP-grasp superfamily ATP-dependent carboligase
MMHGELTPVVVLDLNFAGYGIVRSLTRYGIPVIGFYAQKNLPESRTRLCIKKIHYQGEDDLIEKLNQILDELNSKPLLILTTDYYVNFFLKNRKLLEEIFLIHLPSDSVVKLLLDKVKFSVYAKKNHILIPNSHDLFEQEDLEKIAVSINFPVILKPYNRTPKWTNAKLPKAFYLLNMDDLIKIYREINAIEPNLMVQEWIPGNDSNVHYCLTYFSDKSECLAAFTGYKIRQWPVGTGSTATTAPVENPYVHDKTCEIFRQLDYQGFGSIEYKRHDINGNYYLIEPTVGRLNQQEYVATINGINLPLRCYNFLTNAHIEETPPPEKAIIYIDEPAEIASALVHIRKKMVTWKDYFKSIRGTKVFRYANKNDIWVFLGLFLKAILFIFKK